MAYATQAAPCQRELTTPKRPLGSLRRGLSRVFGGVIDAIYVSRAKQSRRDIALHLAQRGTPLTDAAERELVTRLMTGDWNVRR